jgi:hypothetical protein
VSERSDTVTWEGHLKYYIIWREKCQSAHSGFVIFAQFCARIFSHFSQIFTKIFSKIFFFSKKSVKINFYKKFFKNFINFFKFFTNKIKILNKMHQNLLFTAIPIHRNLTTQSPMIFFTKKSPIIMGVISHEHKANPASVLLTLFQVRFFAFSSANNSSNAKNLLSKQHIYAQKFF